MIVPTESDMRKTPFLLEGKIKLEVSTKFVRLSV